MKTYNSKDLFIVKVLEASTGHITEEDDKLLRREDLADLAVYDVKVGKVKFGYLIYTGLDDGTSIQEELQSFTKASLKAAGFSDALFNLLSLAKKAGCKFLQLDCDGVEYDDLPTFDW
jgi:hypothetical protein